MADNNSGVDIGTALEQAIAAATANNATPQQQSDAQTTPGSSESNSNGNLPWAVVLLPTTSAGHSGVGSNKHGLLEESWVFGFFADGDNAQQPIVVGTIPRGSKSASSTTSNTYVSNSSSSTATTGGGGTTPGSSNSGADSGTPSTPGGGSTADPTTSTTPFVSTSTGIQLAFEILMRPPGNYSKEQAAGIIGNLIVESGLNPGAVRKNDVPKSACHPDAIGICQWNDVRAVSLINFAASKGKPYNDLETQLNFLVYELQHSQPHSNSKLLNATDPISAADAFCLFEKPQGYNSTYGCAQAPTIKARRQNALSSYNVVANLQKSQDRGPGVQ